jgi:hypothetical protein
VTFRATWGGLHGADARRLLAIACRRGDIKGSDVGAIRIEANYSLIDVARSVADRFEAAAAKPDPRNPRLQILRAQGASMPPGRPVAPVRPDRPSHARGPRPEATGAKWTRATRTAPDAPAAPDRPSRHRTPGSDAPQGAKWTGPILRRRK